MTNDKNVESKVENKSSIADKRHTLAHVLASTVEKMYEGVKLTLGPAIDTGFYYDMDFTACKSKPATDEDLAKLTADMREILKSVSKQEKENNVASSFLHKEVTEEEAKDFFKNNKYKLELIDEIVSRKEIITLYSFGEGENKFTDLCRGGHVESFCEIDTESFKLDKIAGAYWRGDEKREMLTRIYGLAFENKMELDTYTLHMEEAKKRDHRVLGKELGLFIFSDLVGPGLPLWTPRGTVLRKLIDNYVQELRSEYNYQAVTIPHITKSDLYKKSGHWEKYAADLYKINTRDGHVLCMKPMNCPHHTQIYASELRSYKELPIRYSETTMVYRDEQSGELSGLNRVLSITQDDAHVFCRESQLREEINNIWNLIEKFNHTFGFTKITPRFSKRDDNVKFKGNVELWEKAERVIYDLLESRAKGQWIEGEGEAAFYGPKIDFMASDSIGRKWQVGTIQLDYVQPTNFGLEYVSEDGTRDMPVMIHCAVAGSLERFLSVYIEHCAGDFPFWLAPMQVKVIPIKNDLHLEHAQTVYNALKKAGIRVELDDEKNGLGKKVRHAKDMKYPYWIVIGDTEVAAATVALESREGEKLLLSITELVSKFKKEIEEKK